MVTIDFGRPVLITAILLGLVGGIESATAAPSENLAVAVSDSSDGQGLTEFATMAFYESGGAVCAALQAQGGAGGDPVIGGGGSGPSTNQPQSSLSQELSAFCSFSDGRLKRALDWIVGCFVGESDAACAARREAARRAAEALERYWRGRLQNWGFSNEIIEYLKRHKFWKFFDDLERKLGQEGARERIICCVRAMETCFLNPPGADRANCLAGLINCASNGCATP